MIVEDQSRLQAFQEAQAAYAAYLRRQGAGERVSFEDLLSEHRALEPILRSLHDAFCRHPAGTSAPPASPAPVTGTTTVVDRRGGHRRGAADGRLENPHGELGAAREADPRRVPSSGSAGERYVPQGELARGGMGAILKVWDRDLGRTLAMKVLLDERRAGRGRSGADHMDRFLQEAHVLARLDHPGIVPVHDVGFDLEGRPYFTMRFVDGLDLEQVLDRVGRWDDDGWNLPRAVASLVKTCQTVAYAHARGIIHRDLKPSNVMVGRFGEVYVIDWGLAKVLEGSVAGNTTASDETTIARRHPEAARAGAGTASRPDMPPSRGRSVESGDGVVVGTPPFMSPEQAEGLGNSLDPRSDIYSLGTILYNLLTGHPPYAPLDGGSLSALAMTDRVLAGPPAAVRDLAARAPAELVAICERAMARDPSDRYPSAMDMAEDLQSYLDGRAAIQSPGLVARMREWAGGNRVVAGLAGVAVLLMTLLPGIAALSSRTDRSVPDHGHGQAAVQETAREGEEEPEPEPESAKKCRVAKSGATCGDDRSS